MQEKTLSRHYTELPRKILVGSGVLSELGTFIQDLGGYKRVLVVSDENVKQKVGDLVDQAMSTASLEVRWILVDAATLASVELVEEAARREEVDVLAGLGGGKSVDIAKLSAFHAGLSFVSVPTSASHDGISSPLASIRGLEKPYSFKSRSPIAILADIQVISDAPKRLLASGCGDLVAKVTAAKDWELARDERNEYFGKYAASLARLSADIVIEGSESIGRGDEESVRDVVEALISAGVAAGIAGSSRPCSGSEHLFNHALEIFAPGVGLHGEKCGIGTIMMARLHGIDWDEIAEALRNAHAPTTAREIGLAPELAVKALTVASSIRPDRYTILNKVKLDQNSAEELARSTGVI